MKQSGGQRGANAFSGAAAFVRSLPVEFVEIAPRTRLADYCTLIKLRLSLLVLVVTAVGFCLGTSGSLDILRLIHVLIGTALVAFSANALNQYIEHEHDRVMARTANRPIPAGRMLPTEALTFGLAAGLTGLAYLALIVNATAAALAAATSVLYLAAYTPLKRKTWLNTFFGAVPGALPPVIGYAAASGRMDAPAWMLFLIVLVWQVPHFYAIAWLYRKDYAAAGYRMLSVVDRTGRQLARQSVAFSIALLGVSLLPRLAGYAGDAYFVGAATLGVGLLITAARLARRRTQSNARLMLAGSLVYLPTLMAFLLLDRLGG